MELSLQNLSAIASIITLILALLGALIAISEYMAAKLTQHKKQRSLESYLKAERDKGHDSGQRTLIHIVRHVGITQDEAIKISFKSDKITRKIKDDADGYAEKILLQYTGN